MNQRLSYLLIILVLAVCFANLGGSSIYILDESKNAACAKEMFQRGDMIVPTFNGKLRGDKPPLHYYFMMASYSLFGVNAFSARFFSGLMGFLLVGSAAMFSRKYFGPAAGLATILCCLSALMFMFEFHLAVPDPYLITTLFLGNICLYMGYEEKRRTVLMLGYLFIALGMLTKGPVAIALSGLCWVLFLLFTRTNLWGFIRSIQLLRGVLVVALISLPWFISVHIATDGAWTYDFFVGHNLDRFTGTKEGHGGFLLASVALTLAVSFPIGIFIPRGLWFALRESKNQALVFASCFGLAPMIFFLFSQTILPNYVMPGIPFLLITVAAWWEACDTSKLKIWPELFIILLVALALPFAYRLGMESEEVFRGLENYGYLLWSMAVGVLAGVFFYMRKRKLATLAGLSLGSAGTLLIIAWFLLPEIDARNPVQQSRIIWQGNQEDFYFYKRINPSYVFYFSSPIPEVSHPGEAPAESFIISRSDFSQPLDSAGAEEIFRYRNVFESRHTVIYKLSESFR